MTGKNLVWGALALLGLMVSGCGFWQREVLRDRPVSIAEALQLPLDAKVYTAFNLWYTTPGKLEAANDRSGMLLPVGTEIIPLTASVGRMAFREAANGREWVMSYDDAEVMMPIEDYMRLLFTLEPLDQRLAAFPEKHAKAIRVGEVLPGMTREEVTIAFGPPSPARTPNQKNSTWIYNSASGHSLRVVFRGNKVRDVYDFLAE